MSRIPIALLLASSLVLAYASCGNDGDGGEAPDGGGAGADASAAGQPDGGAAAGADAATAGGPDAGGPPATHTLILGGVPHMPGNTDPLANCTACHGANLQGGIGRSCFQCHNNNDHTVIRSGVAHKAGTNDTCVTCHGPNNSGGLGPACSTCH